MGESTDRRGCNGVSRWSAARTAARSGGRKHLLAWTAIAVLWASVSGCSSAPNSRQARVTPPPPQSAVASTQMKQPAEIRSLDLEARGAAASLELLADRPLVWTSFRDAQGDLVIELPNSLPGRAIGGLAYDRGLVSAIDVEVLEDAERPLTRLVVRTRSPSEHSLAGEGDALRIQLVPVEGEMTESVVAESAPAEDSMAPDASSTTTYSGSMEEAVPGDSMASGSAGSMFQEPSSRALVYGTADAPLAGPEPLGVAASQLYSVEVLSGGPEAMIQVHGDGEFRYSTFRLENPERFVIDLSGVVNNSPGSVVPVSGDVVDQIRIGQFKPRPTPVSRVVFDLNQLSLPEISRTADGLLVTFGTMGHGASAQEIIASAPPVAETAPVEEEAITWTPPPPAEEPEAVYEEPVYEEPVREVEPEVVAVTPPLSPSEPTPAPELETYSETVVETREVVEDRGVVEDTVVAETSYPEGESYESPAVPVYEPPTATLEPPPPVANYQAPAPAPSDVAMYEAQQVQVNPDLTEDETTDAILESFGTLVVNRQEREYVGEPIDMSLKQADLVETLRSFATISDLNFVIQPGVSGSVTVELKGVPWDQAMEQILKINNLGMDIDGTIVRIAPMAQLRAEAEEQRRLQQARADSVPLRTVIRHLSYATAADVASLLRNRTGSILTSRGTVQVDNRTNALIIRELPDAVDTVLAVIDNLDAPEPQVTIEARIIEATKSFSRTLGIEWGYDFDANQANGNTTGLQFPNTVDTDGRVPLLTGGATGFINMRLGSILDTFSLDARLQVAENEGLVNLVSAPRVTTLNNTAASIQSGVQIPVQTVSNRTVSVQFVNATLQLQVTPQVTAEGTIMMDINVAKRSPAPGLAIVGSTNSPIQTREARTKVIVRDGGTTVIGGIYEVSANNVQDRVPGLSNIPLLGHLFKNRNKSNSNDELMIFITPRIVQM